MTGKQLKNAILQLAIQGKLVPQDANDEPASALLAQIRKEKEQLVKAGKLKKKDLETTPIADEEKPFEIPESWEWVRLGEVCRDFIVPQRDKPTKFGGDTPWCRIEDIEGKYLNGSKSNQLVTKELANSMNMHICPKGTVICACSASIGNQAITTIDCYTNQTFIGIVVQEVALYNEYLYYFFMSQKQALKDIGKGTTISYISRKKFEDYIFPFPPLVEQKRIVAKIEELMPLVEEFGAAQEKLNRLNEALPEALKKSILQQAIQGKLVPQDANDEPASALLAKIRKEKEQLVKAGKLKKKDLETTPIADEEKPFKIPESWEWVRLKDVCVKIVDGDHNPPTGLSTKTKYLMLSSKNVNFDRLVELDSVRYLSKEIFEIENQRTDAKVGDILFTSVGTLGRSCIIEQNNLNICFQRSVSIINTLTHNKYLKRCLDSPYIQFFVVENATGTAQKGFYLSQMEKLLIPLPPLSEQQRIVAKIEELMALVDGMR